MWRSFYLWHIKYRLQKWMLWNFICEDINAFLSHAVKLWYMRAYGHRFKFHAGHENFCAVFVTASVLLILPMGGLCYRLARYGSNSFVWWILESGRNIQKVIVFTYIYQSRLPFGEYLSCTVPWNLCPLFLFSLYEWNLIQITEALNSSCCESYWYRLS
jgi:hypothetical protein